MRARAGRRGRQGKTQFHFQFYAARTWNQAGQGGGSFPRVDLPAMKRNRETVKDYFMRLHELKVVHPLDT